MNEDPLVDGIVHLREEIARYKKAYHAVLKRELELLAEIARLKDELDELEDERDEYKLEVVLGKYQ